MAKPSPSSTVPPAGSPWLALSLALFIGLLLGATGTYLILLPKLPPTGATGVTSTPTAIAETDPRDHLPTPELTAGQTPAQADRTLGNFYYDHQNWAQAMHYYESALKQGADDADIRTDLGNAYRFSNRPDDALIQYRRAQQMNPAHEFSLFNQGGLYLEDLRQPQKAVEIWQEYLRRFPTGSNVAAAQQLIAKASGTAMAPAGAPGAATNPANTEVDRLLRLVPPAPATGKP